MPCWLTAEYYVFRETTEVRYYENVTMRHFNVNFADFFLRRL